MTKRQVWLERINAVERVYAVGRIAADALATALRADPSLLRAADLKLGDFLALRDTLEATYLVRMFAVFEAGARDVWTNARKKSTEPGMKQLIDSLAKNVPTPYLVNAHRVREYRNALVHEGDGRVAPIAMKDAQKYLSRFFSCMPSNW